MWRLLFFSTICPLVASSSGCAQTGACPPGKELIAGECVDTPPVLADAQEKALLTFCKFSPDPLDDPEPQNIAWKLTVEPIEPIVAGEVFGTRLSGGGAVFSEAFLNNGEAFVLGGFKRAAITEFQWTVHVRKGAIDPVDVSLMLEPIPTTCTYDGNGNKDPQGAPPFPPCSQTNDNPDGSNDDCTSLDGMPRPENRCLPFVDIGWSDDCDPGGVCDELAETGPDSPCELNGFCASGPLELAFQEATQAYTAASAGSVLFGWADESTGATIQDGGPNDGTWILPEPVFSKPGPNGFRATVAGVPFAFECTMGVPSRLEDGVDSRDPLSSPTPDYKLISFPISQRRQ